MPHVDNFRKRRAVKSIINMIKEWFLNLRRPEMADARSERARKNIILLLVLKTTSAATNFLMVPVSLQYLDATNYGIWLSLSSAVALMSFFDIGLGGGLRNKIAVALAEGNKELARYYVSSSYAFLALLIFGLLCIAVVLAQFITWSEILNAPLQMEDELSRLGFLVFAMFLLKMFFSLIGSLLLATQSPALNSLIDVLTSVLSLIAVYALLETTESSLYLLGVTTSTIGMLVPLTLSAFFFGGRFRDYIPSWRYVKLEYAKDLMLVGVQFFVLQVISIVVFSSSNLIIAQVFDPIEVTKYNITFRYYSAATMLFGIVLTPFWSAYTDAYHRADLPWIHRALSKQKTLWLLLALMVIFMTASSNWVYKSWVGESVEIPFVLSVCMGGYVLMSTWSNIFVNFLNGVGKIRLQTYAAVIGGLTYIPIAVGFALYLPLMSAGVVLAMCVFLVPMCFLWPMQVRRILEGTATGLWRK